MGTNDDELIAAMTEELRDKAPMDVPLPAVAVLQLSGLIQLACRHSDLSVANRTAAEWFLAMVRDYYHDCPAALEVLRRGDDPAEDL